MNWLEIPLKKLLTYLDERIELQDMAEYITITVKRGHGGLEERENLFGHQIKTKKQFRLIPGSFIISRVQCWHQAYAMVPDNLPSNMIASTNYDQFAISHDVTPRFFWWLSHSPTFTESVRSSASGVVIEKMVFNREAWLEKTIPLPPLPEQRRIVAKIEALAAKIGDARGLRRKAILATALLLSSTLNSILSPERISAEYISLGDIADIKAGVTLGRSNLRGPLIRMPYLRVANVQDGHLNLNFVKEIEILEDEKEKWLLQDGDILLTEGGDWDKLGRGTVWRNEIPNCIHQNHIFRVRVNQLEYDPYFLCAFIGSPYGKSYFQEASKQTTNLASINQRQLKAFKVPRLAIIEQRRIVAYLDGLQAQVDALEKLQAQTAAELDALLPAILDRAFKGEL
jgi:type I restriction enzyme S subunit